MKVISVNSILFKAGKVHLYSDFDGTYLPVKQKDINDAVNLDDLNQYAQKMDKFFKSTKNDLDFHITTGRDFDSYKEASELLKEKNIKLTLPKSFIVENGYVEYLIADENHNFYESGDFPYSKKDLVKPPHKKEKSKAHNIKSILEDTKKNSDLIIVAGNKGNDKEMLNPLKYINLKKYEKDSRNLNFFRKDMNGKLEDLKSIYAGRESSYLNGLRNEFQSNGLLKELESLPIMSIVVKDSKGKVAEDLLPIVNAFEKIGKIKVVERGNLEEGIKTSIENYAQKSKTFKEGMSDNLKDAVFGKLNFFKKHMLWIIMSTIALATSAIVFLLNNQRIEQNNKI